MGFRPELDLKEILQNYEIFGGTSRLQSVSQYQEYFSVLAEPTVAPDPPDDPVRVGIGPTWCSSDTALDASPRICWDVNGYYRSLGVHWRATRYELGRAYLAKNGHRSVWLTYVMRQLLNPEIRRRYDLSPLGEIFLDDDFVQEAIKRRAYEEAYRRTRSKGIFTHRDDVLKEWGLTAVQADDADQMDCVDSSAGVRQDEGHSQETWEYSFYLWRTITGSPTPLRRWQELILRELSVQHRIVRFSVGVIGKEQSSYVLKNHGGDFIIFLNEDCDPTVELAAQAVRETTSS